VPAEDGGRMVGRRRRLSTGGGRWMVLRPTGGGTWGASATAGGWAGCGGVRVTLRVGIC
jgi:hypothetical protein